jgi:hypothetical protein
MCFLFGYLLLVLPELLSILQQENTERKENDTFYGYGYKYICGCRNNFGSYRDLSSLLQKSELAH